MTSLALKPHLLRADTIDLQSQENPSAKDHSTRQYLSSYSRTNSGITGTHHSQALRDATEDAYHEQQHSPRVAGYNHSHLGAHDHNNVYDEGDEEDDDDSHHGVNGVSHGEGYDDGDGNDSQDEDLDDEMLDKISSSPSIEDGKPTWPKRADSLHQGLLQVFGSVPTRGISYFTTPPTSDTTEPAQTQNRIGDHQSDTLSPKRRIELQNLSKTSPAHNCSATQFPEAGLAISASIENISRHLLPLNDPFLDYHIDTDVEELVLDNEDLAMDGEELQDDVESSDDDYDKPPFDADPRFIDSGWGGECLRDTEDIDFEFVYALHTFVATVEGQANATKGDTMVLLDDSNSYWWLVRVVKDGSIGYLPAEHIETPTERLARLNKHRNIDLAAAMLGDNPEKSKNPLKKAMRRRNAKTVNFAPPTFHEPEDRDWSDEEEGNDEEDGHAVHVENGAAQEDQQATQQSQQSQQTQQANQVHEQPRANSVSASIHRVESDDEADENDEPASPVKPEAQASASSQTSGQEGGRQTRKVIVRNTDSFFKDDNLETKKISLTPQLLRGDGSSTNSVEQETKPRPSLDTFDKIVTEDKSKDSKKKEKKGMLSGLFKRKDKNAKGGKNDADETDRASEDSGKFPASKESLESELSPDRKPSKLQKAQPSIVSPKASPTETRAPQRDFAPAATQQQGAYPSQRPQNETASTQQSTQYLSPDAQTSQPSRFPSLQEKRSVFAPITDALRSKTSSHEGDESTIKPIYSKRAKERFAIDDSDSDDGSTPTALSSVLHRSISPLEHNEMNKSRPESDPSISPVETHHPYNARGPNANTNATEITDLNRQPSAGVTPASPSERTASTSKQSPSIPTHTPSTSRSTPTWSDASLRSYMENDQDIRDLLIIVHDKTNVTPVGLDHPMMNGLFAAEKTKLADMQSRLDSMLLTWLAKKNQPFTAKA